MSSMATALKLAGLVSEKLEGAAFAYQEQVRQLLGETERNLLVIAPTGAGKTMAGLDALEHFGKGVYVAPTRALCYEKAAEIRARFPGARVAIGNKDHSLSVAGFNGVPFRVVTPWKLGVIAANNPELLAKCPVVVVDEIHNLNPDMELLITEIMQLHRGIRLVGLSATIHEDDAPKLARWLGGALIVEGHERPVPLVPRMVHFDVDLTEAGDEETVIRVIESCSVRSVETVPGFVDFTSRVVETVRMVRAEKDGDAPVLIYTPFRERARQLADLLSEEASRFDDELQDAAAGLPDEAGDFTTTLKACLPRGIGIHHGGCTAMERELVYELAKAGKLDIIITCQTLAQGVNLPARHVIIESVYDHPHGGGDRRLMDVSLFWQVAGRAGRPQFDTIGYLWVVVGSELERVEVEEVLLQNRASKIVSRVYDEYFLASRVPGLLRAGYTTAEKLAQFMRATFFGAVLSDVDPLIAQFERLLADLCERGFALQLGSRLVLTKRGQRLARLGFHPSEFEAIEALLERQAPYEEWLEALIGVVQQRVLERDAEADEVADVVTYGMTAHATRVSHAVRELVDYLSRLLELTMSLQRFDRADWRERDWFRHEIADRFAFGEMHVLRDLAGVVGRAASRRVLRNVGSLQRTDEETGETMPLNLDIPLLRQIVTALWSQKGLPADEGKIAKVAGVLRVTEAKFRRIVTAALAAPAEEN